MDICQLPAVVIVTLTFSLLSLSGCDWQLQTIERSEIDY